MQNASLEPQPPADLTVVHMCKTNLSSYTCTTLAQLLPPASTLIHVYACGKILQSREGMLAFVAPTAAYGPRSIPVCYHWRSLQCSPPASPSLWVTYAHDWPESSHWPPLLRICGKRKLQEYKSISGLPEMLSGLDAALSRFIVLHSRAYLQATLPIVCLQCYT